MDAFPSLLRFAQIFALALALSALTVLASCGGGGGGGSGGGLGPVTTPIEEPDPRDEPPPEVPDGGQQPDPPPPTGAGRPPEVQDPKPEVQDPKAGVQDPKAEVQDPKIEVEDTKPEVQDPKPEVQEPEPEVQDQKAEVTDPETTRTHPVLPLASKEAIACEEAEKRVMRGVQNCIERAFAALEATARRAALAGKLFRYDHDREQADQVKSLLESISPGATTDFASLFNAKGRYAGDVRDQYIKTPKNSLINISYDLPLPRSASHAGAITRAQLRQHGCIVARAGDEGNSNRYREVDGDATAYIKGSLDQSEACVLFVTAYDEAQAGTMRFDRFKSNGCAGIEEHCLHTRGVFTVVVESYGKADNEQVLLGSSFAAPYAAEIIAHMWSYMPEKTIREVMPMVKGCVYGFVGGGKENEKVPGERLDLGCLVQKVEDVTSTTPNAPLTTSVAQGTAQSRSFARGLIRPERFGALYLPGSSDLTQTLGLAGDSLTYAHNPSLGGAFAPSFLGGRAAEVSQHWSIYLDEASGEAGVGLRVVERVRLQLSQFSRPDFFGGGGSGLYELEASHYRRGAVALDAGSFEVAVYRLRGAAEGLRSVESVSGHEDGFQLGLRAGERVELEGTAGCSRFAGGRVRMSGGASFAIGRSRSVCEAGVGVFVPFR